MLPYLFHIYGPIYANCYGIAIAIGILVFNYLVTNDSRRAQIITINTLQNTILWGTVVGLIGGRTLWITSNLPMSLYDMVEVWNGGLSVLGAIIAILIFLPFYLRTHRVAIWKFLDLIAIYAPLLQAISRLGCFLAGCCYGLPTGTNWGIIYTHPDVAVPAEFKNINLHPTQIYSAIVLFVIFLLMHNLISKYFKKPGQLITIYLMLSSLERFLIDFWRADQEFCNLKALQLFALHQWICISIFVSALGLFIYKSKKQNN